LIMRFNISGLLDDGPKVAMILVRRSVIIFLCNKIEKCYCEI
jgi:hypothetical protein